MISPNSFLYLLCYTIVTFIPLAILACVPFLGSLRVTRRQFWLLFALTVSILCIVQAFVYSHLGWSWNTVLAFFVVIGLLLAFAARVSLAKLAFTFLFTVHYAVLHQEISQTFLRFWGLSGVQSLLVFLPTYVFTMPPLLLIIHKWIRPLIASNAQTHIWHVIWLLPTAYIAIHLMLEQTYAHPLGEPLITVGLCIGAYISYYLIFKAIDQMDKNAALSKNIDVTDRLLALQAEQYLALEEQITISKQARHDLRHHLAVLEQYVLDGDQDKIHEYLAAYRTSLPPAYEMSICNNAAVDAVVRHYLQIARQHDIEVNVHLDIEKQTWISDPDLCIVLGNCLENAVEAARQAAHGKRFLQIRSSNTPHHLTVVMRNSYTEPLPRQGNTFLSRKREGEMGTGLSSIQAIVGKYHGTTRFDASNGVFETSVIFFNGGDKSHD